jgi:ankyrin repeat protein
MKTWINGPMGKGELAPLHLAAYKGRPRVVRLLVQKGAEIRKKSKYGMSVIHFAAQNNQPWLIAYFKEEHGFDLDERDKDGNTPLHWACHFGSVNAAEFLLKWTPSSLNTKNKLGLSPLHLAVESVLASNSIRLIRVLLFAGADRNQVDNRGHKPIDIITKDTTLPIVTELESALIESNDCQCLMLKIPLRKLKSNSRLVFIFIFLHCVTHFFTWTLALPSTLLLTHRS